MLHLVCCRHAREPLLQVPQLAQHVVVHVDLEAEDLPLLELRLQARIPAAPLALFITKSHPPYLTGELPISAGLRAPTAGLSLLVLRCRLGLSAIN